MKRILFFIAFITFMTGCISSPFVENSQLYYKKLSNQFLIGDDVYVNFMISESIKDIDIHRNSKQYRMLIESTLVYSNYFTRLTPAPDESFRLETILVKSILTGGCIWFTPKSNADVTVRYKLYKRNNLIDEKEMSASDSKLHNALLITLINYMDYIENNKKKIIQD